MISIMLRRRAASPPELASPHPRPPLPPCPWPADESRVSPEAGHCRPSVQSPRVGPAALVAGAARSGAGRHRCGVLLGCHVVAAACREMEPRRRPFASRQSFHCRSPRQTWPRSPSRCACRAAEGQPAAHCCGGGRGAAPPRWAQACALHHNGPGEPGRCVSREKAQLLSPENLIGEIFQKNQPILLMGYFFPVLKNVLLCILLLVSDLSPGQALELGHLRAPRAGRDGEQGAASSRGTTPLSCTARWAWAGKHLGRRFPSRAVHILFFEGSEKGHRRIFPTEGAPGQPWPLHCQPHHLRCLFLALEDLDAHMAILSFHLGKIHLHCQDWGVNWSSESKDFKPVDSSGGEIKVLPCLSDNL